MTANMFWVFTMLHTMLHNLHELVLLSSQNYNAVVGTYTVLIYKWESSGLDRSRDVPNAADVLSVSVW